MAKKWGIAAPQMVRDVRDERRRSGHSTSTVPLVGRFFDNPF